MNEIARGMTDTFGKGTVLPGINTEDFDEIGTEAFLKPARLSLRPSRLWRILGLSFVRSTMMREKGNVTFGQCVV